MPQTVYVYSINFKLNEGYKNMRIKCVMAASQIIVIMVVGGTFHPYQNIIIDMNFFFVVAIKLMLIQIESHEILYVLAMHTCIYWRYVLYCSPSDIYNNGRNMAIIYQYYIYIYYCVIGIWNNAQRPRKPDGIKSKLKLLARFWPMFCCWFAGIESPVSTNHAHVF